MTGAGGGKMRNMADILISVPSDCIPRVQEMHIMVGHIMCEIMDDILTDDVIGKQV